MVAMLARVDADSSPAADSTMEIYIGRRRYLDHLQIGRSRVRRQFHRAGLCSKDKCAVKHQWHRTACFPVSSLLFASAMLLKDVDMHTMYGHSVLYFQANKATEMPCFAGQPAA